MRETNGARPGRVRARDSAAGELAVARAKAVGLSSLGGYLEGGMPRWREEGRPTQVGHRISLAELKERHARGAAQIHDVREAAEVAGGRIAGSTAVPWHAIDALPAGINPERSIVAVCHSGRRAGLAASLLQRLGAADVAYVADGGVATWKENGWPMEERRLAKASSEIGGGQDGGRINFLGEGA